MLDRSFQIVCVLIVLLFASCRGTKILKDNEKLYAGATLTFRDNEHLEDKAETKAELEELLRPSPNTTLLGMRPPLWIYYITRNPKKEKGLKNWLRDKFGEEPVLYDETNAKTTEELLQKKLQNEGYFLNEIDHNWKFKKNAANVEYKIHLNRAYHFSKIEYPDSTNKYTGLINRSRASSPLKAGQRYELQKLMDERIRIEQFLRDRGYYYFNNNHLLFEMDTTVGDQQIDARLITKENVPPKVKKQYKIGEVFVTPGTTSGNVDSTKVDTLNYENIHYIDQDRIYKPKAIINMINFRPGDLYSYRTHDLTVSKLIGLRTFRYVNANYTETNDPGILDAHLRLVPFKKKSIRMEVQAVSKSNNFVGPFFTATFQNRNFLRGAELFQFSLNTGFEMQVGAKNNRFSYEAGFESSLSIPKFITPFNIKNTSSKFVPNTIIKVGGKTMKRVNYFTLRSINLGFGYKWNETSYKSHELFPIDINLVKLVNTTYDFDSLLNINPLLRQSYEEQFIFGGRYSYVYNTQAVEKRKKRNDFYFNGNLDLSGNAAYLMQRYVAGRDNENAFEMFGTPYAQFAKVDFDIRYFHQLDKNNRLATRLILGLGYPYGNSETLPYVKQFSIGGSSSIRAFPARSIGPGANIDTDEIDQTGDIKIEWNLEHRFNIIGSLKGAVFVDMGNIWTLKEDTSRGLEGGQFKWNNFLNELAIGTGFGFRYDANYFVIRLDVGIPVRVPINPDPNDPNKVNSPWIFDDVFKRNDTWSGNEFVLNIAIGYPF